MPYKVVHGLAPGTSAISHVSPTYPVDDRCILPADSRVLVAELFRSPALRPGMTSRKTWHQQNHWHHISSPPR